MGADVVAAAGVEEPSTPRQHAWAISLPRTLIFAFAVAAVWRVLIAACAVAAHYMLPHGKFTAFSLIRSERWPTNPLTLAIDGGVRNDALWYARIAQHGYTYSTAHSSSIAFYPLYPLATKGVSLLAGNVYVSGMLVSLVCLFLAVAMLHLWLDGRGMANQAPITTAFLLLFPWSVFYAAVYSESLSLFLALTTFVCFERKRPWLAFAAAFMLALTRPTGILIVPALFIAVLAVRDRSWRDWIPLGGGPLALACFGLYQWIRFGTPVASFRAAAVAPWSRGIGQALADFQLHPRVGFPSWYFGFMLAIFLVLMALTPLVRRRWGLPYAVFSAMSILLPAASGLASIERYAALDFPVLTLLPNGGRLRVALFTLFFYFMIFFAAAFAAGWGVF
jgi:Mannosyltransferase (PIG-V)